MDKKNKRKELLISDFLITQAIQKAGNEGKTNAASESVRWCIENAKPKRSLTTKEKKDGMD